MEVMHGVIVPLYTPMLRYGAYCVVQSAWAQIWKQHNIAKLTLSTFTQNYIIISWSYSILKEFFDEPKF